MYQEWRVGRLRGGWGAKLLVVMLEGVGSASRATGDQEGK